MKDTDKIVNLELEKRVREKKKEIEEKTGRKVSDKGKKIIEQKILEKDRREERRKKLTKAGIAIVGALGVTATAVTGYNSITKDNSNDEKYPKQESQQDIPKGTEKEETIEENKIFEQIVNEYNEKYPETPIKEEDLGIIKSKPQFLIEQTNEDGTVEYVQNYKTTGDTLEENQNYIYEGINDIYVVVNNADKTVILTEGMVNYHVTDIETKIVKSGNNEYVSRENSFTLSAESEAEKTEQYIDLRDKYEERLQEQLIEDDER